MSCYEGSLVMCTCTCNVYFHGNIKVAHHTWIKFLKSRRNSLMMKNEVTDMNVQKSNEKSYFSKNMTSKN